MKKAIISVLGKDHPGIIAGVSNYLAKENVNILDISQTVTGGYFSMMMIVDLETSSQSFDVINDGLQLLAKQIAVQIKIQREEIFELMHRI